MGSESPSKPAVGEIRLKPDGEYVRLRCGEWHRGQWILSHDKTGESMILQGRGLALGADDKGQAFIESDESASKWVCDILR